MDEMDQELAALIADAQTAQTEVMAAEIRQALAAMGPLRRRIVLRMFTRSARKAGIPPEITGDVMRLLKNPPQDEPPR